MEYRDLPKNRIEEAVYILHEQLEIIRINLEILEALRLSDRIKATDKDYLEITQLDRKHRRTFSDFMLDELPGLLGVENKLEKQDVVAGFLEWVEDFLLSIRYLDRITKEFLQKFMEKEPGFLQSGVNQKIKDKRFWSFLEQARTKSLIFESFRPLEDLVSDEAPDPEKSEQEQQADKE